jgi:hypothetical protein
MKRVCIIKAMTQSIPELKIYLYEENSRNNNGAQRRVFP